MTKLEQVAQRLNTQATSIRREGSVPRFHNDVTALVAGKTVMFEYDGNFEYAEVRDNLLVVRYKGTFVKFRQDQLTHIQVS